MQFVIFENFQLQIDDSNIGIKSLIEFQLHIANI